MNKIKSIKTEGKNVSLVNKKRGMYVCTFS